MHICHQVILALTFLGLASPAGATVIAAQTSPRLPTVSVADPGSLVSWTQTSRFANVTITAALGSTSLSGLRGQGTVYLTTRTGSGASPADEIARIPLTNIPANGALETLFTGLTLQANTYYLVAASDTGDGGLGWVVGTLSSAVGPGVTINADEVATALATYSPSSDFFPVSPDPRSLFYFSVTGDPLTGAPVPEPASLAVVLVGLAALGRVRHRCPCVVGLS